MEKFPIHFCLVYFVTAAVFLLGTYILITSFNHEVIGMYVKSVIVNMINSIYYPSSNSAVLINIITGVSLPHFDFVVYYVLCQC
jgi:hypothetical protein